MICTFSIHPLTQTHKRNVKAAEGGIEGSGILNRLHLYQIKCRVLSLLFFLSGLCGAAHPVTKWKKPLITGEIRTIHSVLLNEDRSLNIHLPDSFDPGKKYPVFYLLDGSMNEDFPHIAGLLQFFHLSYDMPDAILIGIANIDRRRDFTFPTTVAAEKKSFPTTGGSARFIRFIQSELKPYIASIFKTNGKDYLIGQSLGGLLATEILLKSPGLFSHYLLVSPSLWWDNGSLLQSVDSLMGKQPGGLKDKEIFITVGGKEDPVMQAQAKQLAATIDASGISNCRVHFLSLPEETHASILHQAVDEDLKKLFPLKE